MRFGYVPLGLVVLASLHISSGQVAQCANGLDGVQNGDVCCDAACGTCGGSGCAGRTGGGMNCCVSTILNSGNMCSTAMAAPCIIDDEMVCSNGLMGVEQDHICCEAQCGTCGGSGCGERPGGPSACCTSAITASGAMCSMTTAAPCIIDDADVCNNGLVGVQQSGVCCEGQCGTCGGMGCAGRPGGPSACCVGSIMGSNVLCSVANEAPCIVDNEMLCSDGTPGVEEDGICCKAQCGTCGGSGCGGRPGGSSACCRSVIEDGGVFCRPTTKAPCIINGPRNVFRYSIHITGIDSTDPVSRDALDYD